MKRIATITVNPAIDAYTRVEHVTPERKLRCEPPRREPGGGGVNVSRAIHRLGGTSTLFYLGGGPAADMLDDLLRGEQIEAHRVGVNDWTRENLIVLETSSGQQFRFGMPGPEVSEEEWKRCIELVRELDPKPDYLVASGSLAPGVPDDLYGRFARIAADAGVRAVIDASGAALRALEGSGAFLLKPNLGELQDLAGRELHDEREQVAAARDAIRRGVGAVIVLSLGRGGARVITADESVYVRTPTVPMRSKVGAGDSMVAGTVLALARGMELIDAVRFGTAAGAAAVMTEGTELCRRDDTERLYEQMRTE